MYFKILKRIISLRDVIFYRHYFRSTFAQVGEDVVLARILANLEISKGFFVDIGAHHPIRFSNTYYFYRLGWNGINVDALPGSMKSFERLRSRDINIECGVGAQKGELKYYAFNEPALNTFSEQEAQKKNVHPYRITNTYTLSVVTLKQLLDEYLPRGTVIDFLSIDVEGFDYEVIASNDWSLYRPRVILIELLDTDIEDIEMSPTARILHQHGYRAISKTYSTFFFVDDSVFPRARSQGAANVDRD